jgi:hypothetical protein
VLGQKQAECAEEQKDAKPCDVLQTKAPSTEEIIDEAQKLNSFVSQSTDGNR